MANTRKTIKLKEAIEILGESRSTIRNRILRKELTVIKAERVKSPDRLWLAEVKQLAERLQRI